MGTGGEEAARLNERPSVDKGGAALDEDAVGEVASEAEAFSWASLQ